MSNVILDVDDPFPVMAELTWAERITSAWRSTLKGIFETGRLLVLAQAQMPSGEWLEMIEKKLPFGPRTAQRLQKISSNPRFANTTHWSQLPPNTRTLEELLRVPEPRYYKMIEGRVIHPEMERKDVLKYLGTLARQEKAVEATPLPDGAELRIGDSRKVLADVPDNSVPLILTDPPYGDEAEPLYRWLAEWSARVLVPGGSLICFTGQSRLDRDLAILSEKLRYWWLLVMPHDQSQRLPGKFVIAEFKPVLWYVKEKRRGRSLVTDVLRSPSRDKSQHGWGQGEGGIAPLIMHLTEAGEQIVDPFAGTGRWGEIAAGLGRRWLGVDVVRGGDTRVEAG